MNLSQQTPEESIQKIKNILAQNREATLAETNAAKEAMKKEKERCSDE